MYSKPRALLIATIDSEASKHVTCKLLDSNILASLPEPLPMSKTLPFSNLTNSIGKSDGNLSQKSSVSATYSCAFPSYVFIVASSICARTWGRTKDLSSISRMLYQLSYARANFVYKIERPAEDLTKADVAKNITEKISFNNT